MHPLPLLSHLLVEEDEAVAALFIQVLTEDGYAVERASDPRDALVLCAARGPDAYALVWAQPVANPYHDPQARYAVLDRLRAATQAPIVICTRYPRALYADHREWGYAAVLEQPCDLQEMLDIAATLCPVPCGPAPVALPRTNVRGDPLLVTVRESHKRRGRESGRAHDRKMRRYDGH